MRQTDDAALRPRSTPLTPLRTHHARHPAPTARLRDRGPPPELHQGRLWRHLSQPAVSIKVRQLKEDSGISWFQSPGREIGLIDSARKLSEYGRNLSGPCKTPEGGPPKAHERPPSQRCELATTALRGESPSGQSPAGPPLLQGNGTSSGHSWPARSSWDNPRKPSIDHMVTWRVSTPLSS
jgi:hypothetical protein